jgi:hypothetical protein
MLEYVKTAPIGNNDAGYNVLINGELVGKVFRYDGQSARRAFTDWTAYLVTDNGEIEDQAQAIKATRWEAVEQMLERQKAR